MAKFEEYYWHFDMLRDEKRNESFDSGIGAALKRHPKARCLDIGCGSGARARARAG